MTRLYTDDVELYDIVFDWDLGGEVDWLLERFGPSCSSVLEPGCGSGRMMEALARRGVEVVGLDSSPEMVEFARARLAKSGVAAQVVEADMTDFDLGRRFSAAVCPINTLTHLSPHELGLHLVRMAAHLEPGARYLVQVAVFDGTELSPPSDWEAERGGVGVHITWASVKRDLERGREEHHSRLEVTSGPRKGEVIEETHVMTAWTSSTWRRAIAASPFTEAASYDGGESGWPRVELEQGGGLMWHELVTR